MKKKPKEPKINTRIGCYSSHTQARRKAIALYGSTRASAISKEAKEQKEYKPQFIMPKQSHNFGSPHTLSDEITVEDKTQ